MASIEDKTEDDFIKCSICFEVYNNPKYLPCLHTFCESCLSTYISSSAAKTENCDNISSSSPLNDDSNAITQTSNSDNNENSMSSTNSDNSTDISSPTESGNGINLPSSPRSVNNAKKHVKTIVCPVCRTEVTAPKPSLNSEEWTKLFPVNHLMVTIMDKQKLKNKTKPCDPCVHRHLDKTAVAWCSDCSEALCESCEEFHRSMKMSRDHKIANIGEITSEQPFMNTHEYCEEHMDKRIETFCYDHNKPCCLTCMTIYHRKCDHVTTLDDASKDVRKKSELAECTDQMKNVQLKFDEIYFATEGNIRDLNTQREDLEKEMRALRVEMDKHLDHLENLLKEEFACLHKENTELLKQRSVEFDNKRKLITNSQRMLEMCIKHATDAQVFLEMKKQQRRGNELQNFLATRTPEVKRIDFELNVDEDVLWITSSLQSLGGVSVKTSKYPEQTFLKSPVRQTSMPSFLKSYKTEEIGTFIVKNSDQFSHWHGVVVLSNGKILISDWTSKTLILYDTEGEIHGEILLSGQPYDVTLIEENELAVSRRGEKTIDIVDIERKVVKRQIKLQYMCFGVTVVDDKLVVACDTSIAVLTLDGKTVREIPVSSGVYCVTAGGSNSTVCYTNFARGTVNCISLDGLPIFSYKDDELKGTLGVATDNDGNVYVAGRETSCVYQLSPDGVLMKTLLSKENGVENPWTVQIDKERNRLLVTHSGSKVSLYQLMAMYDYY